MTPRISSRNSPVRKRAKKAGYQSGLEHEVALDLQSKGVPYLYEAPDSKIRFVQPAKSRTYLPDFILPNGIIVECKGQFTVEDRQKHLLIHEQHPSLDIRFVFSNPNARIRKGSNTTLSQWCDKHGFLWADKLIPKEWLSLPKKGRKRNGTTV